MSIWHDAYLFRPEEFAAAIVPYLEALETDVEGHHRLREAAIRLFDHSDRARALADRYGGWDRASILELASEDDPKNPADKASWIVLMLYDHLKTKPGELGLGGRWELMDEIMELLGWDPSGRKLLIHGYSYTRFAQEWIAKDRDERRSESKLKPSLQCWNWIRPYSTASNAGWLAFADVQQLLARLASDQQELPNLLLQQTLLQDSERAYEAYQLAEDMFEAARAEHSGLCLITSG